MVMVLYINMLCIYGAVNVWMVLYINQRHIIALTTGYKTAQCTLLCGIHMHLYQRKNARGTCSLPFQSWWRRLICCLILSIHNIQSSAAHFKLWDVLNINYILHKKMSIHTQLATYVTNTVVYEKLNSHGIFKYHSSFTLGGEKNGTVYPIRILVLHLYHCRQLKYKK